ncbi:hypothetical protein K458DRAFT_435756 [Lentithecium fluviatile CBS 122367]|uniref:RanBP2-type domain-containing protein n=1 Tax=Lentithecium fluviatile CBS 122367 TaxID=1168545 RepID=A0A6G1IKN7_9PLEO|nr:hypothetical protein K458DRAFT_435756 [Lentithecium fluviatile CBS 122367]
MAQPQPGTVPNGIWVCCVCKQGNVIDLGNVCPYPCGHVRDSYCSGPGQPYPATGLFPDNSDLNANGCYAHVAHQHQYDATPPSAIDSQFNTAAPHNNLSDPPKDVWVCGECGAANCTWYELCPVCNRGSKAATPCGPSEPFNSLTQAGTPCQGFWQCECGASNSGLTPDFCPICGRRL